MTTTTTAPPITPHSPLVTRASILWHKPLLVLAVLMGILGVVSAVGLVIDSREILGAPLWAKPFKFAISIVLYALTLSWLITMATRFRRVAWTAGTVIAIAMTLEIAIVVWAALTETTSHFNVSTPFSALMWSTMGAAIIVVWLATLVIGLVLSFTRLGDTARAWAIRLGVLIGLIGMGLAFLMTSNPSDLQGISGAHAVGIADGGPGLPILGWSTVAGDLRVPHFIGMHGLQLIPLGALLLEVASRRLTLLRDINLRRSLIIIFSMSYLAIIAILTAQALMGQSVVEPQGDIITATLIAASGTVVAIIAVVARAHARGSRAPHPAENLNES